MKTKSTPKTSAEGEARTVIREKKGNKKSKEKAKEISPDKTKADSPDKTKAGPSMPRPVKSTKPSGGHLKENVCQKHRWQKPML